MEAEAEEYEQAKKRHRAAKLGAESAAIEGYELRCYREGQLTLRQDKARSMAVLATHTWAPRSEDAAIAFGLDRRDRTGELASLRKLPRAGCATGLDPAGRSAAGAATEWDACAGVREGG